jgi:RNA polymerase-interacting CarD/CdnL/TRCF family regulator
VPVACATTLGLRPIANSLATILACLRSKPRPLPDDDRQRAAELKTRSHAPQPAALSEALRDLLNRSLTRSLNSADKSWLTSACEHLSAEAALVDAIDSSQARAAIQSEVDHFKLIATPRSTQQGRPASNR